MVAFFSPLVLDSQKKHKLMALVLCCKGTDRQLQWEGKSKITEHTMLTSEMAQPETRSETAERDVMPAVLSVIHQ